MRLLQVDENGEFSLTDDLIDDIPPYAILSHTWGKDDDEVSFKDLTFGPRRTKVGYKKLRFCERQAAHDGLKHFWVDTCCIDKSNNTELSEAINSMFRWYHNAAKCYVYLSDVSTNYLDLNLQSREQAFQRSRWFTRGWTLQELIAPPYVEFFCSKGERLGDKRSLALQLHEITGIAVQALQGTPLSEFSTKREEDKAYSLLGVFDICMPLIYGEGMKNAFRRLRNEISGNVVDPLRQLPNAVGAPFNSYDRQHDPTCLPETRVGVLCQIQNWAYEKDKRCIFWLSGLAGTGKSTIARTVAHELSEGECLGASFFFSRGGGDVGHAGKFVTSVALQLANSIPDFHQYVCDAVSDHKDIANRSLRDQWRQLVLRPLSKLDGNSCQSSYILVVDALDECDDDNNIQILLHLFAEARSLAKVRLRIFLTSRPEIPIRYGICQIPDAEHQDFILHNVSPLTIDHDISIFLEYTLKRIGQEQFLATSWPEEKVIRRLVQMASGLFIWAATACRFIREGKRFAPTRLDIIVRNSSNTVTAPERYLEQIYTTVLKHSISPEYTSDEKEESYCKLKQVLGSIAVLFSPLSGCSLSRLLGVAGEGVYQTLEDLHSVIDVPKDQTQPLRLHHPSFRDFLLNHNRCRDPNFWIDEKRAHQTLAKYCVGLMSAFLKRNVCGLNGLDVRATDIEKSRIEKCLPPEVQYACLYWSQHLQKGGAALRDDNQVHQFLKDHLLHWLEALGWMGEVSEGIHAISRLESITAVNQCPRLSEYTHDIWRFILYSRGTIEHAPLQTYCSALIFSPQTSITRRNFQQDIPTWIQSKTKTREIWNEELLTLEGHLWEVRDVAFSPDGKELASASDDGTVKLWDISTGAINQTLQCTSTSYINAVAFSPDGKKLVLAVRDKTIQIWDIMKGEIQYMLQGHLDDVKDVAFSPDGKLLASASTDKTIRLWDAIMGKAQQTLKGHSNAVNAITFSPDGNLLASASYDCTVKLWEVATGATWQTLSDHIRSVCAVAFSPDGKQLASASADGSIKLWDAATGAAQQTIEAHQSYVNDVVFSPDGKRLASASGDETVLVWDTITGELQQEFKGHSNNVSAVSFSPDGNLLASASYDCTVKVWQMAGAAPKVLSHHSGEVTAIAFSPDGTQLASGSFDIMLWDTATGAIRQTLGRHSRWINAIVFSPNGMQLASASYDKTIKLWDTRSGAALYTLTNHSDTINAVAFWPDGKKLASASGDKTVQIWDIINGKLQHKLQGHLDGVQDVAISLDGQLLASASSDGAIKLWDPHLGVSLQTFKQLPYCIFAIAFSPDGKILASFSEYEMIELWDTASGAARQMFEVDVYIQNILFSEDMTSLETNRGSIHILPSDNAIPVRRNTSHGIFVKQSRISIGMEDVLLLPFDYQPNCTAVHGNIAALGHKSGRISILEFDFESRNRMAGC